MENKDIYTKFKVKINGYCDSFEISVKLNEKDFTWIKYSVNNNVEYFINSKKVDDITFYNNEYSEKIMNVKDDLFIFDEEKYLYILKK